MRLVISSVLPEKIVTAFAMRCVLISYLGKVAKIFQARNLFDAFRMSAGCEDVCAAGPWIRMRFALPPICALLFKNTLLLFFDVYRGGGNEIITYVSRWYGTLRHLRIVSLFFFFPFLYLLQNDIVNRLLASHRRREAQRNAEISLRWSDVLKQTVLCRGSLDLIVARSCCGDSKRFVLSIDYECEDKKKIGESACDVGASLLQKTPIITPKHEPFSQEMHLKIPLLNRSLKLSNSKPGCRVSAQHVFVK